MTPEARVRPGGAPEEPPPLGSWRRLYVLVIVALVADLALLIWLTQRFH